MTTTLEACRITPPPGATELTVPLSFFDIVWLNYGHPIRRLLFYNYPCSPAEFTDTVVPQIKESLSLTLKYYLPVAGNLLYPLDTEKKPVIRYVAGDSVSLTIAESNTNFDELVGNHPRDADQFYDFTPQMPPVKEESGHKIVPLIALQVTHFPGQGLCVGFANNHVLGDGSSISSFILAWASINKFGGDNEFLTGKGESLPIFDRSVIQDTNETDSIYWNVIGKIPYNPSSLSSFPLPTNRVRATFILTQADITNLKNKVLAHKPDLLFVSSFVVTASYIWTCLAKSAEAVGEQVGDNEKEILLIPADARGRLNARINPPIPANYFGNCIAGALPVIEHKKLAGEEGFLIAAETTAAEIRKRVNNKDEFLKDVENWLTEILGKMQGCRMVGISGSPKFDLPNADFGWGKARKLEVVSMDGENYAMSMCKARDSEGGLEVGLSLPKERMEAFAAIFADGLSS